MTTGGTLRVTSANEYKNFEVKFLRNTEITNFTRREMGHEGDIRAEVKNGRDGFAERIYSNGSKSGKLGTLDLNTKRYAIFDALRKLDGNDEDISDKDLLKADTLIGKNGVKGVRRDASAGVTTIVCDDGAVLRFDVETEQEKQVRLDQEAANSAKRKQKEAARVAEKQREAAELKENCKSDFEKLADWFIGLFN